MAKFLLFSDIHIHPHKNKSERLLDCLKVLDWVFQQAIENKVDSILFGGDLLHDRQKIDSLTYMETFKVLEKYKKEKFNVYLLLGNHDLWFGNSTRISSTYPFGALDNVEVIDKTQSREINGVTWHFMPYNHDPIKELEKLPLAEIADSYLLGHIAVDGARLNSAGSISDVAIENDGDMVKIDAGLFKNYKRVFFGHYHAAQNLADNVEYIGSPLQLSFGEAEDKKHIIILDSKTNKLKYIENTFSPKHIYLNENDLESPAEREDLKNAYVEIAVTDASNPSLKKTLQAFSEANKITNIRTKIETKIKNEHVISDIKKILSNESELLENYLEQDKQVSPDLDKALLVKIGKKVVKEAEDAKGNSK